MGNAYIYVTEVGTALETKFAPAYANLLMTGLEERLLKESVDTPIVWMKFIDDAFFIWTHGEEKLVPETFIDFSTVAMRPLGLQGSTLGRV